MNNIFFKYRLPIYDVDIIFCFDESSYYKLTGTDTDCLGCVSSCIGGTFIIFIREVDNQICLNTVSHEAFHCADFIMDYIGGEYKECSGNEHVAYLIGHITEKIIENYDNLNKIRKRL